MTASVKHETGALLRAHLAAATSYRHLTSDCPVCRRIQRLAMEAAPFPQAPLGARVSATVRLLTAPEPQGAHDSGDEADATAAV
ncbi:DUF6274 family protein [Streptomyces sp. NPDC050560]|uniref:DUF6274 family protein n=1 Tax=Streptomyces sp. NPDC050560 TaxID=3365630 RepID=UPI003792949F